MKTPNLFVQGRFLYAKVLLMSSAAAELIRRLSPGRTQTSSPSRMS